AATTAGALSSDVATLADAVLKATAPHRWKIAALTAVAALLLVVSAWSISVLLSDEVATHVAGPVKPAYYRFQSTGPGGNRSGWLSGGGLGESDLGDVTSLSLSPNNTLLASTSQAENWIRLWELASGRDETRLRGPTASIPV